MLQHSFTSQVPDYAKKTATTAEVTVAKVGDFVISVSGLDAQNNLVELRLDLGLAQQVGVALIQEAWSVKLVNHLCRTQYENPFGDDDLPF